MADMICLKVYELLMSILMQFNLFMYVIRTRQSYIYTSNCENFIGINVLLINVFERL